jgi:hypothetical protein
VVSFTAYGGAKQQKATHDGSHAHLQEQYRLLPPAQLTEIDCSQPSDGHRGDATKEAVDVLDVVLGVTGVHDAREDERYLCFSSAGERDGSVHDEQKERYARWGSGATDQGEGEQMYAIKVE